MGRAGSESEESASEGARALTEQQSAAIAVSMEAETKVAAVPTEETLHPLIDAVVTLLSRRGGQWSGKCSDLLEELALKGRAPVDRAWPSTPQQLGTALRCHKDDLDRVDVEVLFRREGKRGTRVVTFRNRLCGRRR